QFLLISISNSCNLTTKINLTKMSTINFQIEETEVPQEIANSVQQLRNPERSIYELSRRVLTLEETNSNLQDRPEHQQEDENPWNCDEKEESTWSTNNKEVEEPTTTLSIEQENPYDVVVESTNNNYFEFGLAKFLLAKLKLADGDYVTFFNPLLIQYSQGNIRDVFQHSNRPIEDTINQLLEDEIDCLKNIPTLEVCIINEIYYFSDNRKLYCIKEAIKRELKLEKIPVLIRKVTDTNIQYKLEGAYKIVKNKDFNNIVVSSYARNERVIEGDGFWECCI
ncbi:9255_t:CDS:2, partial [Dentiscutata erythropus]